MYVQFISDAMHTHAQLDISVCELARLLHLGALFYKAREIYRVCELDNCYGLIHYIDINKCTK